MFSSSCQYPYLWVRNRTEFGLPHHELVPPPHEAGVLGSSILAFCTLRTLICYVWLNLVGSEDDRSAFCNFST